MPNTYHFPSRSLVRLHRESHKSGIHELCYLLFGRGARIIKTVRVPNRAEDTVLNHVFGTADFERARSHDSVRTLSFLAYLHTHPCSPARPSPGDVRGYEPGTLIFIYADISCDLRAFRLRVGGKRYVEKPIKLY